MTFVYARAGSLTTPPCTETTQFLIQSGPMQVCCVAYLVSNALVGWTMSCQEQQQNSNPTLNLWTSCLITAPSRFWPPSPWKHGRPVLTSDPIHHAMHNNYRWAWNNWKPSKNWSRTQATQGLNSSSTTDGYICFCREFVFNSDSRTDRYDSENDFCILSIPLNAFESSSVTAEWAAVDFKIFFHSLFFENELPHEPRSLFFPK